MSATGREKLNRFFNVFSREDHVLVAINADPDAISSAMALRRLLWRKVASVTIACINVVKRPDNLTMLRLLDIKLVQLSEVETERFTKFAIVDSQPSHDEQLRRFTANVVIDHHPITDTQAEFQDIRPNYGATASIMTEYLRAARIKPSTKLAAGLFYGIKTDTQNFTSKTVIEDVRAFQFLFRHANLHIAQKIEQSELKPEFLKYFKIALDQKHKRKKRIFIHLGPVSTPDVCVLIADFFMKVSDVAWSIVSGRHAKKLVIIFRNDGVRKNAGKLATSSFGQLGSSGGHKNMARAEIPYVYLKDEVDSADDAKIGRWIVRKIEQSTAKTKPEQEQ